MTTKARNKRDMPDVPDPDFVGALCEIWFSLSSAAYHLAYVRVYLHTGALQIHADRLRKEEQVLRDMAQVDVIVCRAHLASFFWQLDHVFEALRAAIIRGQKEHPEQKAFWSWEGWLRNVESQTIPREINAYRNKAHEIPAVIGCKWDGKDDKFLHHFLPTIEGHEPKESIDMNDQLQKYFEYVANVWLYLAPPDLKFPRDFTFPVTVPYSHLGGLPPELDRVPQLQVEIEAFNREEEVEAHYEPIKDDEAVED
jgi:hypothetical protein